jgi:competence ComEA-like helix-hairpin-helix protein
MASVATKRRGAFSGAVAARAKADALALFVVLLLLPLGALAQKKHPPAAPLDLNTATIEQLEQIPQIGAATAKSIVNFREKSGPFRKVDELLAIKSISQAKLEKIRPYVTVTPHE